MMKELKDPQPLWKRLLALSGFLILTSAALAYPTFGGGSLSENFRLRRLQVVESFRELIGLSGPVSVEAQIVAQVRTAGSRPTLSEINGIFRDYARVTPAPRRFLMTGPILREKPLG